MRKQTWIMLASLTLGACATQPPSTAGGAPPATAHSHDHAAHQGPPGHGKMGMMGPGMMQGGNMMGNMTGPGGMSEMCPEKVPGTTARAEDVEGGAALSFTTTGDVAEVRRRVQHMAEMHNQHHGAADGKGSMGMMGGSMGMMSEMMPPSTARAEDVDGGARLILTPEKPADLTAVREKVHKHAEMMAGGQCPMMSQGAKTEAPAPKPAP